MGVVASTGFALVTLLLVHGAVFDSLGTAAFRAIHTLYSILSMLNDQRPIFWLRFFGGYITLGLIGLIVVSLGWIVSIFINDYNIPDSSNIKIVNQIEAEPLDLQIPEIKKDDIWADGITYEEKVKEVGTKLIKSNHINKNISFKISYDKNEEYIAYSIPSDRHIVITNQILSLIHSDDELASIIGHEMAHIEYNQDSYSHKILESGDEQTKHFKKEFEADVLGATMAKNAGYNPAAAIQIFKTLLDDKDIGELNYNFDSTTKTHPPTQDRINVLEYLIHRKYPEYEDKDIVAHWSLYDDMLSLLFELEEKQELQKQNSAKLAVLEDKIDSLDYTREADYERDLAHYNSLVKPYNTNLKNIESLKSSIRILLKKYSG